MTRVRLRSKAGIGCFCAGILLGLFGPSEIWSVGLSVGLVAVAGALFVREMRMRRSNVKIAE